MNGFMRAFALVSLPLALFGCATAAQRQYQAISTGNQAIATQAKACLEQYYNAPEAAILRPHAPMDVRQATLLQLSDQSFATKAEADAILTIYPRLQACRQAVLNGLQNTVPSIIPILAKDFAEADDDTIALLQRKVTWGEHVRRRRDLVLALQSALQVESQRITAALEASHEAELAQRQEAIQSAGAALQQWSQTQQVISNMNRTTFTNCMRFGYQGNMVNCTTY
jgi:hypothetical protein